MTHVLMSTCVVTTPVIRLNDEPEVTALSTEVTSNKDGADYKNGDSGAASAVVVKGPKNRQTRRKKQHHRRGRKNRKWKPYNKLSWDEKLALEDQEARRAERIRDERLAHGQPVAPYNTTQFLMEDHNIQEPDLGGGHHHHHRHQGDQRQHHDSGDVAAAAAVADSDEYYYSSPDDEDQFLQKEFCEVYDSINAERLASMSKLQLIQEYMQLEERVDKLENKLPHDVSGASVTVDRHSETSEKVRIFQQEIRKLAEENDRLRQENAALAAAKQAREAAKCEAESKAVDKQEPPSSSSDG